MITRNRTIETLALLLPAGVLGSSVMLGAASAAAFPAPKQAGANRALGGGLAARLLAIRDGVSAMAENAVLTPSDTPEIVKAWWGNGHWGWHNGGWGWHNGGWVGTTADGVGIMAAGTTAVGAGPTAAGTISGTIFNSSLQVSVCRDVRRSTNSPKMAALRAV
ncbi:MAG: hypothetical protein WDN04_18180 [Rhodospirillales bacterium]